MAITDTHTTEDRATGSDQAAVTGFALPAPSGPLGVLGSGDHKTIGRIWLGASGVLGTASLALLGWFALEALGDAGAQTDRAFANLTLGVLGLVLGCIVPGFIGLATAIVPLQVGASTIAFPRAAAAALWGWLCSAGLFAVSYLPTLDGGVGGGKVDGSVLGYLAVIGLVASLLLGAVCVMTTIVTLRAPGMTLDRVPLLSWSMLVAGGVWLLSLPVLAANALFIVVDLKYGTPALFGDPAQQWTQLSWLVTPPQVFAWVIPVLGIAGDAVATFAKGRSVDDAATEWSGTVRRQPQRGLVLTAVGAFGAVTFGAYAQPAFDPFAFRQWAYVAQVAIVVLPLLAVVGGFATALRRGVSAVTAPLVLGLTSLLLLVVAALVAVPFVIGPLELQTTDGGLMDAVPALAEATAGPPVYTWGVLLLVVAAAITGTAAGLVHWAAKLTGRSLPAGAAKGLAPLLLVGGLLSGVPFLVLGFANKADGLVDAAPALLGASLAGAVLLLVGVAAATLLTLAGRVAVLRGAARADADPWGTGATLEWATESPPPPGNVGELPPVTSPEPLLDLASSGGADGGAR